MKVYKYGDNVDTDVIIPARHLNNPDPKALASHCMEDIDAAFASTVEEGDIIAVSYTHLDVYKRQGTWCLVVFMVCNVAVSCMALTRYDARSRGEAPEAGREFYIDARYDDENMARIYPNAVRTD